MNLKYQNSLNIGYNANPIFSLMNNHSQSSYNIRGFIMDAKSHVCSSFFYGIDFWHLSCLSLIETSFVFPILNRHSFFFIFDLPSSGGKFHVFFSHSLSHIFLICPKSRSSFFELFLKHCTFVLNIPFHFCLLLLAPSVGCDPGQGFFLKEYFIRFEMDCKG